MNKANEQILDQAIAACPKELEPNRNLFPGIEYVIQAEPTPATANPLVQLMSADWVQSFLSPQRKFAYVAACILVLSVFAIKPSDQGLNQWLSPSSNSGEIAFSESSSQILNSNEDPTINNIAAALADQFEEDKALLLARYQGQPNLSPNWEEQLGDMDTSVQLILDALEENPNNPALLKILQKVYMQQFHLIQTAHIQSDLEV